MRHDADVGIVCLKTPLVVPKDQTPPPAKMHHISTAAW
jgi:hypothetical protein